jgi:hypothetical protein
MPNLLDWRSLFYRPYINVNSEIKKSENHTELWNFCVMTYKMLSKFTYSDTEF